MAAALLLMIGGSLAFAPPISTTKRQHHLLFARGVRQEDEESFLLQEFKTHSGEILNPYQTLKVSRTAEISEIKTSYRNLSRRYHPDVMRHKDILPGSCNNMDEVRDEWERIKLAYEILKDKQTRRRFDRHEMLANPNAAMQRAAMNAVGKGLQGFGKGLFNVGAFAVQQMSKAANGKEENEEEEKKS